VVIFKKLFIFFKDILPHFCITLWPSTTVEMLGVYYGSQYFFTACFYETYFIVLIYLVDNSGGAVAMKRALTAFAVTVCLTASFTWGECIRGDIDYTADNQAWMDQNQKLKLNFTAPDTWGWEELSNFDNPCIFGAPTIPTCIFVILGLFYGVYLHLQDGWQPRQPGLFMSLLFLWLIMTIVEIGFPYKPTAISYLLICCLEMPIKYIIMQQDSSDWASMRPSDPKGKETLNTAAEPFLGQGQYENLVMGSSFASGVFAESSWHESRVQVPNPRTQILCVKPIYLSRKYFGGCGDAGKEFSLWTNNARRKNSCRGDCFRL